MIELLGDAALGQMQAEFRLRRQLDLHATELRRLLLARAFGRSDTGPGATTAGGAPFRVQGDFSLPPQAAACGSAFGGTEVPMHAEACATCRPGGAPFRVQGDFSLPPQAAACGSAFGGTEVPLHAQACATCRPRWRTLQGAGRL